MSIPGVAPLGGLFGRSSNSPAAPGGGMSEQQMMMFVSDPIVWPRMRRRSWHHHLPHG